MDNVQLRCPHCNGPLTYEDRTCPYCGMVNTAAAAHVEEMDSYTADFTYTKETARAKTKANAKVILSALLLALMVAGVTVNVWISANMYDILDRRAKAAAEADHDSIDSRLMSYLEEGDYLRFNAYIRFTEADVYSGAYRNYRPIFDMTLSYWIVFRELSGLVLYEEKDGAFVKMDDRAMSYIVMGLTDFYKGFDPETFRFHDNADLSLLDGHMERMDEDLKAMMITYLGVTGEEYETIREYGKAGMSEEIEELLWELWERREAS